jgi:hypothetical protein
VGQEEIDPFSAVTNKQVSDEEHELQESEREVVSAQVLEGVEGQAEKIGEEVVVWYFKASEGSHGRVPDKVREVPGGEGFGAQGK